MSTRRDVIRNGGIALAAAGFAPVAFAAQPATKPESFRAGNGTVVEAERGTLEVPEDRRDPRSRRITLSYLRFKATTSKPGYPLVYLAGGPGGSGVATARGARFPLFMALREVGDVIAFDQRGTGDSNQIPPPPAALEREVLLTRSSITDYYRAEYRRAWDAWKAQGVAIEGYNSVESAHDLDDLRRVLGADKLNLWGISYGSHLALAALKYHGKVIHKVALASLEGLDQTVKSPAHLDGYLAQVDALLKTDPAAAAAYPDLLGTMRRVHDKLEREPARMTGAYGFKGKPMTLTIGAFAVQAIAGSMIKNPPSLAQLPGFYKQLDAGRYATVAAIASQLIAMPGGPGSPVAGMGDTMDLASGISPARLAQVEREAKTALLGDALNFPMPQIAGVVPGIDLGDSFRRPIRTDIPALLISGSLDGRTPITEQAEVAAQFRNKTWLRVNNAGHDVLETTPEIATRMVAFFKGQAVDATPITLPPMKFLT